MQDTADIIGFYEAFFNHSLEGILVLNEDHIIKFSNFEAEKILRFPKHELSNQRFADKVPANFQEECDVLCCRAFEEKTTIQTIVALHNENKAFFEVRLRYHFHPELGSLVIVIFYDVTHRLKIEQDLEEERKLYINILEEMTDSFISFDHDWHYTYINEKALQFFDKNKNKADYIGKVLWEVAPGIISTFEEQYRHVMEKREPSVFYTDKLLMNHWFEIRAFPHDGGIAVLYRDSTEQKQREQELERSNKRFAVAFCSSPIASAILRFKDGCFIDVNTSFTELFGYDCIELLGTNIFDLGIFDSCSEKERKKLMRKLKNSRMIKDSEIISKTKTGALIYTSISAELINLYGESHILASAIDITEKKKKESSVDRLNEILEKKVYERTIELTQALEREKEGNDLKSRFVSTASHEFRTPLACLLTSVSLLEKYIGPENQHNVVRHLNKIKSSVNTLTDILNDFLSLDKLEHGKVQISGDSFCMKKILESIIDEMNLILKKGQYIRFVHSGEDVIFQDKKIIYNALINLISNAIKYSPENKCIEILLEVKKSKVICNIKDGGLGIPESEQKNIFSLFFRARNVETIQGTGLGLAIVKKYMELIGGKIYFTSIENEGSVFTIEFPKIMEKK